MRHIPNVLSAIRLILVGVFIFLFARAKYLACLIVFLTAFSRICSMATLPAGTTG